MSLSSSPKVLKGGLVILAPGGGALLRTIALQYNPDSLSRSYQVQGVGGDGGGARAPPFRLKGPAIETIKHDAAIEALVNPSVDELLATASQSASGTLEILPPEAPLVLFIWSKSKVVPVRITELSVTEEAFDPQLNPIRAKISLGMRVMTTDDLGFTHKGGTIFMTHLRTREALAAKTGGASLSTLGIANIP